jgi:hypothetical protein
MYSTHMPMTLSIFLPLRITVKTLNSVASELHRPSDRSMSAKLVPTFAGRGCRVVSTTDPQGRTLGFLDRQLKLALF